MIIKYTLKADNWWTELLVCDGIITDARGKWSDNIIGENIYSFLDKLKIWGYTYTSNIDIIRIDEIQKIIFLLGKPIRLTNRKWAKHPYNPDAYFDYCSTEEYNEKIKTIDLEYQQDKIRKTCDHLNFIIEKFENYPDQNKCLDCGLRFYEKDRKDLNKNDNLSIMYKTIQNTKNVFKLEL